MPIQLRQATWQQPGIDPTGEVISKVGQAVRQGAGDYQDFLDKKARAKALEDQAKADKLKADRDILVQDRDYNLRKGADERQGIEADRENNDFMRKQERQAELEDRLNRANQEFAEKYGEQNLPPEEVFRVKDEIAARNKLGGTEEGQRFVGKDQSLGYAGLGYKYDQLASNERIAALRAKTAKETEGMRIARSNSAKNAVRLGMHDKMSLKELEALAADLASMEDIRQPELPGGNPFETTKSKKAGAEWVVVKEAIARKLSEEKAGK